MLGGLRAPGVARRAALSASTPSSSPEMQPPPPPFPTWAAITQRKRRCLQPVLLNAAEHWWKVCGKTADDLLPRSEYVTLGVKLYRALVPARWDEERAVECALEDWRNDAGDAMTLPKHLFYSSLFELADAWLAAEIAPPDLAACAARDAAFLDMVFEAIAKPAGSHSAPSGFTWKETEDIACIIEPETAAPQTANAPAPSPGKRPSRANSKKKNAGDSDPATPMRRQASSSGGFGCAPAAAPASASFFAPAAAEQPSPSRRASLAAAVIAEEPARPPSRPIAREDKTPITIQAQQQTGYLAPSSAPSDANSMEVTSSFSYEVAPSASRPTTGLKSREKGSRGGSRQGIGALSRQSSRGAAAAAAASSGAAEPGTPSRLDGRPPATPPKVERSPRPTNVPPNSPGVTPDGRRSMIRRLSGEDAKEVSIIEEGTIEPAPWPTESPSDSPKRIRGPPAAAGSGNVGKFHVRDAAGVHQHNAWNQQHAGDEPTQLDPRSISPSKGPEQIVGHGHRHKGHSKLRIGPEPQADSCVWAHDQASSPSAAPRRRKKQGRRLPASASMPIIGVDRSVLLDSPPGISFKSYVEHKRSGLPGEPPLFAPPTTANMSSTTRSRSDSVHIIEPAPAPEGGLVPAASAPASPDNSLLPSSPTRSAGLLAPAATPAGSECGNAPAEAAAQMPVRQAALYSTVRMTPTASQRRSRTTRLAAAGPTAGRRRTPSSAARETYGGKLIGPLLEEELSNSAVAVLEAERRLKIFQRTHRPTARFVTGLLATNWHDSEQLVWPPIASSNVAPPLMPSKSMGMMGGAPAMTGGHTLESLDDISGPLPPIVPSRPTSGSSGPPGTGTTMPQ